MKAGLFAIFGAMLLASPSFSLSLEFLNEVIIESDEEEFGGLSGIEVIDAGAGFVAVSDKGTIWRGRLMRDEEGMLSGVEKLEMKPILTSKGLAVDGYNIDAEGIDRDSFGRFYISFESNSRVSRFDEWDAPASLIPNAEAFAGFGYNSGPEALAIGAEDQIMLVPERSGKLTRPFPIYVWDGVKWEDKLGIPRKPPFLVVGLEYDPAERRLYVLERDVNMIMQFSTRIRSFTLGEAGLDDERTLLQTRYGEFGNVEGISFWQNKKGQKFLTLISDDNFLPLFSTWIIEFEILEAMVNQP